MSAGRGRCHQLRRPVEPGVAQEGLGETVAAMLGNDSVDPRLCGWIGCAAQRQRGRAEPELEQPVAACGLQVIVALTPGLLLPIASPPRCPRV